MRHRVLIQALTLARLLTREPWQDLPTLQERFGVSRETILRQFAALRAAGFTVERRMVAGSKRAQYRIPRSAWRLDA